MSKIELIDRDFGQNLIFKRNRISLVKKAIQLSKLGMDDCIIQLRVYDKKDQSLVEYVHNIQNYYDFVPSFQDVRIYGKFRNHNLGLISTLEKWMIQNRGQTIKDEKFEKRIEQINGFEKIKLFETQNAKNQIKSLNFNLVQNKLLEINQLFSKQTDVQKQSLGIICPKMMNVKESEYKQNVQNIRDFENEQKRQKIEDKIQFPKASLKQIKTETIIEPSQLKPTIQNQIVEQSEPKIEMQPELSIQISKYLNKLEIQQNQADTPVEESDDFTNSENALNQQMDEELTKFNKNHNKIQMDFYDIIQSRVQREALTEKSQISEDLRQKRGQK